MRRVRLDTLTKELIVTNHTKLPENLVASAITLDKNKEPEHAGILIGVEGVYYIFHFYKIVEFSDPTQMPWLLHKSLDICLKEESIGFLAHCQRIKQTAKPKFGFIFDGSYYKNGVYYAKSAVSEYTTCVGFCINVISGYLFDEPKYFEIGDWETIPINSPTFKQHFENAKKDNPKLNEEDYKAHHRRIFPAEYLAAAYINSERIPIRKKDLEKVLYNLNPVIKSKIVPKV